MNNLSKKLLSLFFSFILIAFAIQPIQAKDISSASRSDKVIVSEEIQYLENGMTLSIIITEDNSVSPRIISYTRSGSKTYLFKDSDGNEIWHFTVTGVFTVTTGVGATCTSASYSTSISDDAWELDSASAYESGNQAVGTATFIKKILFITIDSIDCDVTLTCDANGSLS